MAKDEKGMKGGKQKPNIPGSGPGSNSSSQSAPNQGSGIPIRKPARISKAGI